MPDTPTRQPEDSALDPALALDTIGPYRLLESLGSGGMGEVYKAEQRTPIRRIIAIKIVKLGFDSREVIARFESERQALARMDHPHIARVLDAGITVAGRSYFVMEYVPGKPITQFADDNKLNIRQRLKLFTQACDAIAHAHTKAIIHRDIKPGNVLAYLDGQSPIVKIIDFGIAKALTGDRLTDATFNTERGQVIGTYDSMSPEQADGSPDIDTRTDVYSLGVLLYELLSGAKPFDKDTFIRVSDQEIKRIIREVDPPRPSTRLSELGDTATKVAERRDARLEQLSRDLRRELEWIPLKAMRKERARRYASPQQLKEDIENYLEGKPLLAAPESRAYRASKFLRRHRTGVAASAAMFFIVLGGTSFYIHNIRAEQQKTETALEQVEQQKAEADRRRDESDAVSKFLTDDVLFTATPARLPDKSVRDVIVKQVLDPAADSVETRFRNQPLIEASVRETLAMTYNALGRSDLGARHASIALQLRRRLLGDDHPDTLAAINNLGFVLQDQGKFEEAEKLYRESLAGRRQVLGNDHPDTLTSIGNMGALLQQQGKLNEAEPFYREAVAGKRRVLGEDRRETIQSLINMATLLHAQGKLDEAAPLYREVLHRSHRLHLENDPDTLIVLGNTASLLQAQGKLSEAAPLYRESLERSRKILGDDHPDTLRAISNMGYLLQAQGKLDEAAPFHREALERYRKVLGDDHPDTLIAINNMASLLQAENKLDEAELLFREAVDRSRRVLGDDHPDTLIAISNMGLLLQSRNKLDEAEPFYRETLERRTRVLGADHSNTLRAMSNLGSLLEQQKKFKEAEPLLRTAMGKYRQVLGDNHIDTLRAIGNLGLSLQDEGELEDAEPLFAEVARRAPEVQGPPRLLAALVSRYGVCLAKLGKYEQARVPLEKSYDQLLAAGMQTSERMSEVVASLVEVADHTNRPADAAKWRAATRPAATQSSR